MNRINLLLASVLAVLSVVLVVLEKPWAPDRFQQSEERRNLAVFAGFTSAKAARITIRQKQDSVLLERRAQGWVLPEVAEYRANEEAVARLLERVAGMKQGDLVTRDSKQHERYRVQESEAVHVVIQDNGGQTIADFYQGRLQLDVDPGGNMPRQISAFDGYVRPVSGNEVYRISPFEPLEPVRAIEWLPRNLFRFDVTAVQTLVVSGSDVSAPIALSRDAKGEWTIETGQAQYSPANREACDTLARSFSSVYLQEIVGPYTPADAGRYGFERPRLQAVATLAGGGQQELLIGNEASADSYYGLGSTNKNVVLKVLKSALTALNVPREKFTAPPAPPASAPADPNK
ncbi:MAG: DUF4340 domain-containing protein [Planctomycetes bacterium]|nr:DUF4340 domain-containing protein [Planctomycetota bacterium]